jgi:MFS transporter, DHA2 family, multidrug resistance protein
LLIAALILAINFAPVPNKGLAVLGLFVVALAAAAAFVIRQRRARAPLYDLQVAARPTFWVAAVAGIIIFGSLMGAMYIGQQFLQNVLSYSTIDAGAAILPAAIMMVLIAPRSAKLVESHGSRFTMLTGYVFVLLGFVTMLVLWKDGASYWPVGLGYAFVGIGVGFAGTPASHSLTGSVPITRVGMASGTADLQRDLGGAIMQSIFGALLTAGYASAMTKQIGSSSVTDQTQEQLTKSFSSAADTAQSYPPSTAKAIVSAAQKSFVDGQKWAYVAGIVAVLGGAALVFFFFPRRERELALVDAYHDEDERALQPVVDLTAPSPSPAPPDVGTTPDPRSTTLRESSTQPPSG